MSPTAASQPNQLLPVFAGIAWLLGAAAIGYLAFLQLEYSSLELADADEARALALWNGASAAITAYFGAMAILSPTRKRMGAAVVWGAINVAWGAFQVSQGVTHAAFTGSLVAFGLGTVLAFVAWSQLRGGESAAQRS
jgi:membrane associated rhomboid family serine protease